MINIQHLRSTLAAASAALAEWRSVSPAVDASCELLEEKLAGDIRSYTIEEIIESIASAIDADTLDEVDQELEAGRLAYDRELAYRIRVGAA